MCKTHMFLNPLHVSVMVVVHKLQHVGKVLGGQESHPVDKNCPVCGTLGGLQILRLPIKTWKQS